MPTTVFLLIACWAFSKSSPRLHHWLREHRTLGASVRRWQEHRCIPVQAKFAAILSMSGSMTYLVLFSSLGWRGLSAVGAFLAVSALIVLRLPSTPVGRPEDCPHRDAALAAVEAKDAAAAPSVIASERA